MLATDELIQEAGLAHRLADALPRWLREVPLYQRGVSLPDEAGAALSIEQLRRLPFITKQDIRRDFPRNFLRAGVVGRAGGAGTAAQPAGRRGARRISRSASCHHQLAGMQRRRLLHRHPVAR